MPKVAILGTQGTGKTVLMTVLAKAFQRDGRGVRLIPRSHSTGNYVENVWNQLSGGDWPPSTPEGVFLELNWDLQIDGVPDCLFQFVEISGEAFRSVFGGDAVPPAEALLPTEQQLLEYMVSADVIALLVNLRDFTSGEADIGVREQKQWALKHALDWLHQLRGRPKRCLLLFSQSDRYEELCKSCGSWEWVARDYLPYVYNAYLRTGRASVQAVSAVGNTRVIIDEDGKPQQVPDTEWRCRGFVSLMKWIGVSARGLAEGDVSPFPTPRTEAAGLPGGNSGDASSPDFPSDEDVSKTLKGAQAKLRLAGTLLAEVAVEFARATYQAAAGVAKQAAEVGSETAMRAGTEAAKRTVDIAKRAHGKVKRELDNRKLSEHTVLLWCCAGLLLVILLVMLAK